MCEFGGYRDLPFLAQLYDYASHAGADLDFYRSVARDARSLLELGCGTGRVLIPLAEAGFDVTGLDISPHMLERCRQKLASLPNETQARARLVQGDMSSFELDRRFDLILIPFRAFQHLVSVEAQMGCLKSMARHLEPEGRVVIDVFQVSFDFMHSMARGDEQEDIPPTSLPDGSTVRRTARLSATHRAEQMNDVELIFHVTHPEGGTERLVQAFPFRYFFRYEMEHLLARCGFEIDGLYGDFDFSPLADDSPEMIFVARSHKPAAR